MDRVVILRYGEIHLKGKNRAFFENLLKRNILEKLHGVGCRTEFAYGRYVVSDYDPSGEADIIAKLRTVFGLFSLSRALRTTADTDDIAEAAAAICPKTGKFRITASRADKTLPYTSVMLATEIGGRMLERLSGDRSRPAFS